MFNDFLHRTKLNSIVILSTETVFKFDLFYKFLQLEKNGCRLNFFVTIILHYFTSDYLHMLEECVNLKIAACWRNYWNNQYKKLRCLFTNRTWEKDTRLCNNFHWSSSHLIYLIQSRNLLFLNKTIFNLKDLKKK